MIKILIIFCLSLTTCLPECGDLVPFDEEWGKTDCVFVAHVLSHSETGIQDAYGRNITLNQLEISKVFKGEFLCYYSKTITIIKYTIDDYSFEEGADYLVFANFTCNNTMLKVSKCSRTCKIDEAGDLFERIKEKCEGSATDNEINLEEEIIKN